ncbi:hypothetical protein Tco_1179595 [Tanacetum coccineum]
MQFFMGLDDSYMQFRSTILSRKGLPDVEVLMLPFLVRSLTELLLRSNQNFSVGPSRPNNLNNNRQSEGSGVVCENCGFNGHTIDRCSKTIGYPADFGKKKSCQNFKKQNISNNNSDGKSSSSRFTDEQMATLISLKDNKAGINVQANMTGANQHMTCTKELDNVFDISHLKIKVGHPNGTEAYISKIGNLKLSNSLTLYDVMIIPEYCVTLISVHKLVKENKIIIAFDENRCYFLNHDLNLKNILGIDKQCEGLYYYNDKELVIPQTLAKQTREPFTLSDHTFKSLGDLVHLNL